MPPTSLFATLQVVSIITSLFTLIIQQHEVDITYALVNNVMNVKARSLFTTFWGSSTLSAYRTAEMLNILPVLLGTIQAGRIVEQISPGSLPWRMNVPVIIFAIRWLLFFIVWYQ